jgi:predicted kinase
MNGQVRLNFETREEAVQYAQKHGIPFEVIAEKAHKKTVRAYADNFAFSRKQPWTH